MKKTTKAILNEFRLPNTISVSTLSLVPSTLKNTTRKRLKDECLLTLFTGQHQDTPVGAIVTRDGNIKSVNNIEAARMNAIVKLKEL